MVATVHIAAIVNETSAKPADSGDMWIAIELPAPTSEKSAYSKALLSPGIDTHRVERLGECANRVDRLWTPSHESNQRSHYNHH